ncbi:MAG: helix-turn-helix domain-containing protein [Microbacteriaceae bacterium]
MSEDTPGAVSRFLALGDVAEILSISVDDAAALVHTGELPAIRVGGGHQWRVERVVLESYIQAMYEESRRMSLWLQSDFGNIPELSGGTILKSDS